VKCCILRQELEAEAAWTEAHNLGRWHRATAGHHLVLQVSSTRGIVRHIDPHGITAFDHEQVLIITETIEDVETQVLPTAIADRIGSQGPGLMLPDLVLTVWIVLGNREMHFDRPSSMRLRTQPCLRCNRRCVCTLHGVAIDIVNEDHREIVRA
jgi:hypothetical protein